MAESSMSQLYQFDRLCPKCGKEYGDHRYRGENAEPACPERHPMPVESRDDLTSALADWDKYEPDASTDKIIRQANAVADAARGAAKRIAELEAEINHAANRYDLAIASRLEWRRQAITADRALAEERERHQWRTIESAPKDGARIDLWTANGERATNAWWSQRKAGWLTWGLNHWGDIGETPVESEATHWKPLDEPAATAIRSGKPDGKE